MARTELPNGVILPAEYSDDWYEDMTSNLTKLDDVIGSDSEKLNADGVYFLRMSSAALTDSGTGNFSDLNSSYKIKTGDLVLDSGRKLYQIVSVDSANSTFSVGNSLFKVTAESDLATVAESGDYDDLTDLPTYGITRLCSSAITDNSTVVFSAISSTDKIKAGDFLLDTNGKLYQISSVDTANETVSVTTPLTQLAVDSGVMHLSGNETASGEKTFDNVVPINGVYIGNEPSATFRTVLLLRSRFDTVGKSGWLVSKFRSNSAQGALSGSDTVFLNFDVLENEVRTNGILRFTLSSWSGNAPGRFSLIPNSAIESYLGTSGNKWAAINGINPGALSLPNLDNGLDISGYITAGNSHNEYTPTVDGWISVILKSTGGACGMFLYQGGMANGHYSSTSLFNESEPCVMANLPVKAGTVVNIDTKGTNCYVYSAKFYPCQGNI